MKTDVLGVIKTIGLVLGYFGCLVVLAIMGIQASDGLKQQIVYVFGAIAVASAGAVGALGVGGLRTQSLVTTTAITTGGADAAKQVLGGGGKQQNGSAPPTS